MRYTKDKIEALIQDVYDGVVNINYLPVDLYKAIYKYFLTGLDQYKTDFDTATYNKLVKNIKDFAGSKTYSLINSMQEAIKEVDNFDDYKELAKGIFNLYDSWGQTEHNSVVLQSQNIVRWEQIQDQKKDLPYLQYSTVIDSRTSEICLELNGITLPVDDKFWLTNTPQNHYNCRCVLIQLDEFDAEVTKKDEVTRIAEYVDERKDSFFDDNVGISKEIFNENHPYFKENGNK